MKNILAAANMRLVNLTESIWPKRGLNMTETDQPYLLEHDRKMTTTNVNLLSLTKIDWIWPNAKNIINFTTMMKIHYWSWPNGILKFWSYSHDHFSRWEIFLVKFIKSFFVVVSFWSCSNFSVKFIRSNWISQVNNPPFNSMKKDLWIFFN